MPVVLLLHPRTQKQMKEKIGWKGVVRPAFPALYFIFLVSYALFSLYIGTLSTAVLLANHGFQKKPLRCCKTNMLRLDRCALGIFTQLTGSRGFYSSLFQMSLALLIQIHNFLEIDLYMCLSCTFCRKWDSKLTRQGGLQRYPLLWGSLKPSYVWVNLLQRWDCK